MLVQSPSSNQLRSGRGHTLGKLVQPVLDDDDLRWGGGVARRCAFFDEQEALAVGGDVPVTTEGTTVSREVEQHLGDLLRKGWLGLDSHRHQRLIRIAP